MQLKGQANAARKDAAKALVGLLKDIESQIDLRIFKVNANDIVLFGNLRTSLQASFVEDLRDRKRPREQSSYIIS